LVEVISLEVQAESVGTAAGAQSWRQRVPDFRRCIVQVEHMSLKSINFV